MIGSQVKSTNGRMSAFFITASQLTAAQNDTLRERKKTSLSVLLFVKHGTNHSSLLDIHNLAQTCSLTP
jgi:hypothetical protein